MAIKILNEDFLKLTSRDVTSLLRDCFDDRTYEGNIRSLLLSLTFWELKARKDFEYLESFDLTEKAYITYLKLFWARFDQEQRDKIRKILIGNDQLHAILAITTDEDQEYNVVVESVGSGALNILSYFVTKSKHRKMYKTVAINMAAEGGNEALIDYLLRLKPVAIDKIATIAIRNGHAELGLKLAELPGVVLDIPNIVGSAISKGNTEMALKFMPLLEKSKDSKKHLNEALEGSGMMGNFQTLKKVIELGADNISPAFLRAIEHQRRDIVKYISENYKFRQDSVDVFFKEAMNTNDDKIIVPILRNYRISPALLEGEFEEAITYYNRIPESYKIMIEKGVDPLLPLEKLTERGKIEGLRFILPIDGVMENRKVREYMKDYLSWGKDAKIKELFEMFLEKTV